MGLIDGSFISLDSTSIEANTSKNNSKSFDKTALINLHRLSLIRIAGSVLELPLIHITRKTISSTGATKPYPYRRYIRPAYYRSYHPSQCSDGQIAIPCLKILIPGFRLMKHISSPTKAMMLKTYDFVHGELHGHCFILEQKKLKENRKTLPCGNPICDAGFAMIKDGRRYLKGSIKQKFRCPFYLSKDNAACTCAHPKFFNGARKRGCIKYISTGTDYRSSINRDSPFFKSIYSLRTESERYNSRWKNLNTDKASVRSLTAIQNLNTVGHICLLAVALAAVKSGKTNCSKSLKGLIKSA